MENRDIYGHNNLKEDHEQTLLEKERQEILFATQKFIETHNYKDETGSPLRLGKVIWPTIEDLEVADELEEKITEQKDNIFSELILRAVQYLRGAAVFDPIETRNGHAIRRDIESALSNYALGNNDDGVAVSDKEKELYAKCESFFRNNRLSRSFYTAPLEVVRVFPFEYSAKTKELFDEEEIFFSTSEVGKPGVAKEFVYDTLNEEEKIQLSKKHALFLASLSRDLLS